MKVLITEKLSPNKYIDNSGYLICKDAILARTGSQQYRKNELFLDSDDNSIIEVDRSEEEVFSPETLASFENKPVTVEHPGEDVNPENYKDYSVGFVRDVHRGKTEAGEDVILGTLVITDQDTIENIQKGIRTELSCGYDCDISDDANGNYAQCHIRGNHVALCEEGRAGIAKIVDSKIKDDYTSFLGNYGFDYLKGSGDYEYWYLKYEDEDFNKLVNRMRQEYPSMIISASPANKTIYIQKSKYGVKDSKIKDSYYVVACLEGDYWYNEQGKPDKFENAKRFATYEEADRFRNSGKGGSVNKINDSIIQDVEPREDEDKDEFIQRFMKETVKEYPDEKQRFAVANSYWSKAKDSINDADITKDVDKFIKDLHSIGSDFNDICNSLKSHFKDKYDLTVQQKDLEEIVSKSYQRLHLKDSKVNDYSYTDEEWFEFVYENCKYSFVKGGYGMKFNTPKDYQTAKNYAKKVHMTNGSWDDADLTYWDYRSTVIGNDSKIKDSYTMYKGYGIEYNFYGKKEYTVQYAGDDIWFKTEAEAKKFIDEITSKEARDSKQQIVDALSKIYHKAKDSTSYVVEVLYPDGTLYKKFKIEHDGVYDSEIILKNFFRVYPEYKNDPWLVQINK